MHFSSDSSLFFKRINEEESRSVLGWRLTCDLSEYTHVSLISYHLEPRFKLHAVCRVHCNLLSKSITDPYGTIALSGGTGLTTNTIGKS